MFEIVDAVRSGDTRQIIAQSLGILAFLIAMLSFQSKTQRRIVCMQMIASLLFTVHYFILGITCGCILNGIAFLRAFVYSFRSTHRWAASVIWLYAFSVMIVLGGVYSIFDGEGLPVIIAVVGSIVATVGYRLEKASAVRTVTLIQSPLWLIYASIEGSTGGALSELFSICSIIIGKLRLDFKRRRSAELTPSSVNGE